MILTELYCLRLHFSDWSFIGLQQVPIMQYKQIYPPLLIPIMQTISRIFTEPYY